jgi:hypothetical protein
VAGHTVFILINMTKLTQQRLIELLHYDSETGVFTWKVKNSPRTMIGDVAGTLCKNGYIRIFIDKHQYRAHRLAWMYITGSFPKDQIDHINGNRNDNRFYNLRECSNSENQQNLSLSGKGESGYLGVTFRKGRMSNQYIASIKINGKSKYIGSFDTAQDAHEAYLSYKKEIHKFNPVPMF